jgi:iron complex outermembrane receptor protein
MSQWIVSFLVLGALIAGPLAAEESQKSDIEVVVTASRVEEPAENVPANVTVVTADDLVTSGQTTLVDALENLAGLHFRSSSGNAAQAEISMRGFGENSFGRVLVLLDGRRLNRPDMASINWLQIPIENIERVEVIRGGSSVLYGDNAVAGVINIITKRGSKGFDVSMSGQYGSFNANQERAGVSGSAGPWRFSANAEHTATDGYRDRSAFRSIAAGTNIGLDLGPLSTTLALSYDNLFFEMPGALTKAEYEADPTQAQQTPTPHTADETSNQYANADLGFSFSPQDRWLLDAHLAYGLKFIQNNIPSFPSFSDLTLHTVALTPKVKVDMDLLVGNRLVAGVDGYIDLLNLKSYTNISRDTTSLETQISKLSLGLYAHDELSFLSFLTLTAGLRYELARIAAKTLKTSGTNIDEQKLHQALVYDAGLLLRLSKDLRAWVRYSTTFRYPFVDEQVSIYGFGSDAFYRDLKPETGYNLEAGAAFQLFGMLTVSGNGFLLDMKDEIVNAGFPTYANVNLDKSRHLGVEAQADLVLSHWLELSGNYTFTQALFLEGPNDGKSIPLVPVHQASADAVVHLPLGCDLGGSGQYVGASYAAGDFGNTQPVIDGYFLLGAFVRYRPSYLPGKLELYFGVENLLNTLYSTVGVYSSFYSQVFYYPGQGRSWKIGGSYRY